MLHELVLRGTVNLVEPNTTNHAITLTQ